VCVSIIASSLTVSSRRDVIMPKRLLLFVDSSQTLRFILGGGVSVIVFYVLFVLLTEVFKVWYFLSAFLAWIIYYTINFTVHKFWTFKNKDKQKLRHQLKQHLSMALINLCLNALMLYVSVEIIGLWYLTAQIIITFILTTINYVVSRKIFK